MNYLIKNKKYTFMLIFFICSFFFIPNNVFAYVYKGDSSIANSTSSFNGTIVSGQQSILHLEFDSTIQSNGYDLIGIKFAKFNLSTSNNFNITNTAYTFTCSQYSQATNNDFECSRAGLSPNGNFSSILRNGDFTINAYSYNSNWTNDDICFFSDELKDTLLCPFHDKNSVDFIDIYLNQYGYDTLYYDITVSSLKLFYNYDSTEIIKALGGVSTNINATTSAIESQTQQQAQQNAYIQNSNISQAQTNTSDSITVLNDQLTSELSQFSDLTQLVVAPITMFMELNNNVCAPLTLQIPFVNQTAVLPCIKPIMTQYFGGMYSVFTTVIGAILCYWTFVRTVALIKDLVDADNDKIEVVDL